MKSRVYGVDAITTHKGMVTLCLSSIYAEHSGQNGAFIPMLRGDACVQNAGVGITGTCFYITGRVSIDLTTGDISYRLLSNLRSVGKLELIGTNEHLQRNDTITFCSGVAVAGQHTARPCEYIEQIEGSVSGGYEGKITLNLDGALALKEAPLYEIMMYRHDSKTLMTIAEPRIC